jgi:anaerobic selenocysteine-containing dehydrogenase
VIRCGWGLERNRNGGNAALAILALPAVAGKFGVRGGGFTMSNSVAWPLERTWIGAEEPTTRVVNMNRLGWALTEMDNPPVKVLFVYNCNPAVTLPDQNRVLKGLARKDLYTVVFDQVLTDTARYADLVLPATTFLESRDIARVRSDEPSTGQTRGRRSRPGQIERGRLRGVVGKDGPRAGG